MKFNGLAIGLFIALAACDHTIADEQRDRAVCQLEAKRTYAPLTEMTGEGFSAIGDYTALCMKAKGYRIGHDAKLCPMAVWMSPAGQTSDFCYDKSE